VGEKKKLCYCGREKNPMPSEKFSVLELSPLNFNVLVIFWSLIHLEMIHPKFVQFYIAFGVHHG